MVAAKGRFSRPTRLALSARATRSLQNSEEARQTVSSESLLKWPIEDASGGTMPRSREPVNLPAQAGPLIRQDKNAIVAVQWLVAIATSYLIFAVHDWNVSDPLPASLILICLASVPIVQRIPDEIFEKRVLESALLVLDSILIVSAMTLAQEIPWDLLILFFFCVFIAAIGENLIHIGVGCVLLSLVFLLFASPSTADLSTINANVLFRVPFMFGISIFYGHMASQVKQEKKRMEKLEETMRLKRQIVCALAHDIKTPLNVILGHAELLADAYGAQPDSTKRVSSLKSIRENSKQIVELITDFLTVSKLESLKSTFAEERVQMNEIAASVVEQQTVVAQEKSINLIVELDEVKAISGERNQLQRVLWNLVGNAIKFTPFGGTVAVMSRMIGNNVAILVKDSGIGIPEEDLSILFSEFRRLRGAANSEGTGLGLFIVKTIVEAHGGSVAVESEPGVGTTFTVLLPTSTNSLRPVPPAEMRQGLSPEHWSSEAR
jgi:signal transduction histidine kinase